MKNISTNKILAKILDIINFSADKEEFINKFVDLTQQQTLLNLITLMPKVKQLQLQQALSTKKSLDDVAKEFQKIFSPKKYQEELTRTTNKLLNEYLISLMSSLTINQRKELKNYLQSITAG